MFKGGSKSLLKMVSLLEMPDTDYWYDVGCDEARRYLDSDDRVLYLLNEKWAELSLLAQQHLAYIWGKVFPRTNFCSSNKC